MVWHTPAPWEAWRARAAVPAGLGESQKIGVKGQKVCGFFGVTTGQDS